MQRFLLINQNQAVSKLVTTAFEQLGFEYEEISNFDELKLKRYLGIVIDSQMYDKSFIEDTLSLSVLPSLIYLKKSDEFLPEGIRYYIEKPFLLTDFINFLNDIVENSKEFQNLNIKPRKNIFEALNEHMSKLDNNQNNILKSDDIDEIKDIIDDSIFGTSNKDIPDEDVPFKDYELIEESIKKQPFEMISIDEIDEDDMMFALTGKKEESLSFEVVKGELRNAIEYSVATLSMQSSAVKEALKGLKMNITITFEDR